MGEQGIKNAVIDSTINAGGSVHIGDVTNVKSSPKKIIFSDELLQSPSLYVSRRFVKPSKDEKAEPWNTITFRDIIQELEDYSQIIILGDAGFGKSTELRRIHFELATQKKYKIAYYELKSLESKEIPLPFFQVAETDRGSLENCILLLDGIDEVNFERGIKVINLLKNEHSNLKIIVTCRSVAYNNTLTGFEPYFIQKLNQDEQIQYLSQVVPGLKDRFLTDISSHIIRHLVEIPFYLVKAIEYYKSNENKLPSGKIELLQYFIEESLNIRISNTSNININDKLRKDCYDKLEKVAFILECLGRNSLSKKEFHPLLGENRELISLVFNKSSLIHYQNDNFQFAHLIIQEYLAGKVLSTQRNLKQIKKVVGIKPTNKKLKTSWVNSVADLWSLLEQSSPLKTKLLGWLIKSNPEIFVKFERNKFESPEREYILEVILRRHQKNDHYFDYNLFHPMELASFCQSTSAFQFLFEELLQTKQISNTVNILSLLRNFGVQYFPKDRTTEFRKWLTKHIYSYDKTEIYVRYLAVDVLLYFYSDLAEGEITKMVEKFFDSSVSYERASAYKIIWKTHSQVVFIEILLKRILQLQDSNWRGDTNLADEDYYLERCFKQLESENQIVAYFERYSSVFGDTVGHTNEDYFFELLEKAIAINLSTDGRDRIFQSIKENLAEKILHDIMGTADVCIRFLEKYQKAEDFLSFCLATSAFRQQKIVTFLLGKERIQLIIESHKKRIISREWIQGLISWLGNKDMELMNVFVDSINASVKVGFKKPVLSTYNSEINRARELKKQEIEKKLCFSKDFQLSMVEEVFDFLRKNKLDKKEVFPRGYSQDRVREFYDRFPRSMLFRIDDLCPSSKDEILKRISKDWEWISLKGLQELLEGNEKIKLNEEEILVVREWCDRYSEQLNLGDRIGGKDFLFAYYTLKYNFTQYEDHIYLSMIGVGLQRHLGPNLDLVKFALEIKEVPFALVKEKIIKILKEKKINGHEFYKHIEYARDYHIVEGLPYFREIMESQTEYHHRRIALEAFIQCEGDVGYIWDLVEITPFTDRLEVPLIDFCMAEDSEKAEKMLLKKFTITKELSERLAYAEYLLNLGNLEALKFLIQYTKEFKKSPFSFAWERSSIEFYNIKGMRLLLNFYDLSFNPEIIQENTSSITRKVQSMIYNLALKKNGALFSQVMKSINSFLYFNRIIGYFPQFFRKYLPVAHENTIKSLKYFSDDLSYRFHQIQSLSMDEAIRLYNELVESKS